MRSMKFEKVQIHFLSEFSVPRRPEILLPWQRDVKTSHLHYKKKKKENTYRHVFQNLACSRQPLAYQSQTKDRRTKRIFRFLCFFVGLDAVTSYNISYLMAKRE